MVESGLPAQELALFELCREGKNTNATAYASRGLDFIYFQCGHKMIS
jgi:hypothetical protein